MPSAFAELEKLVSAALDDHHGEQTRLDRRVAGGRFSSAASEEDSVTLVGVVDFNPVIADPKDRSQYDGFQPVLAGDKAHVSYAVTAFESENDYPKKDDTIVLLERGNQALRISRVDPDGLGRLVCVCV